MMYQESMIAIATAKKATTITEDLGLTEIICPNAVLVTIENINSIAQREVKAKGITEYSRF